MPSSELAGIGVDVNGKRVDLPPDSTVIQILQRFDLPQRGVAVEVSGTIVPRSRWATTTLRDGDRVEVVHMVGGG